MCGWSAVKARWLLICFTKSGIKMIRIKITSPTIASDQEIPLSAPKIGDKALCIVTITQETAIYKGFRIVFID
jgi:hypothetical protein